MGVEKSTISTMVSNVSYKIVKENLMDLDHALVLYTKVLQPWLSACSCYRIGDMKGKET
jgi:hypothetical protein